MTATEYADGLRAIAAFYDLNPDVPVPLGNAESAA